MKRPAFQFYPADWRKDTALQLCSIASRGVWLEMLCVMHECVPYGHLALNGAAMPDASAARLIGVTLGEYRRSLAELERSAIYSKTSDGVIFSRRMVKDEHIREVRAAAGKLGGNPKLLVQEVKQTVKPDTKQTPTPSSSSSSSSSEKEKKPARKRATPIPPDFGISERVKAWAEDKGYGQLDAYLEAFVGRNLASGKQYIDWDQSFMNAIREDWYGVREQPKNGYGKNGHGGAWWDSEQGIIAKGKELDMAPFGGEGWPEFKARINQRLNAQRR